MVRFSAHVIPAIVGCLIVALSAPAVRAAPTAEDAEIARLIDSTTNPLPILPVVSPQDRQAREVDFILAAGNLPTLFQISQPSGPDADPAKIRFFEMLATEYALKVNFRKVAAGSGAALRLYDGAVTKPVYILCKPAQTGNAQCALLDEAALPAGRDATQTTIEDFINRKLGIVPTLLTTFPLTPANAQSLVFQYRPNEPNPPPTASWIAVFFFPGGNNIPGPIIRVRALIALERFFYSDRLRIAECDLSTAGEVYRAVLRSDAKEATPSGPELWLVNPATPHSVKYTSGGMWPPIADMGHTDFKSWLDANGVARPPKDAIDAESAFRALAALEGQTGKK